MVVADYTSDCTGFRLYNNTDCDTTYIQTYEEVDTTSTSCLNYGYKTWAATDAYLTTTAKWNGGTATLKSYYKWGNSWAAITKPWEIVWSSSCPSYDIPVLKSMEDRISEIIRNRVSPNAIVRRKSMEPTTDIREIRARETLRRVLGDQKFFVFLKKGFVTVMAKSGLVYQISPGHGMTNVWDGGKVVERLCIYLRGDFPPTDSLIMRYLMILNNEDQFRSMAIKHNASGYNHADRDGPRIEEVQPNLVDLFNDLKKKGYKLRAAA